ncbi:MAG: hypothetical protein MHPDNHAH_02073 [Anaerolineales bacterium]|nr:hypothetical protein [Anaerolineales bacterium]
MSGKFALVIGNTEYADPGLAQLTAPGKDAEDFARVLKDRGICSFDEVNVLLNEPESSVRGAIDEFFDQKKPDDLLVLYFSGHGVRDEVGALYLAVKNTTRSRLRSTAIKSDYIREVMDQSRSRRQVLVLDCCNSGAFQQGTKAATGMSVGTASAFEGGYGRIILTASDSTQFAWEGDKVIGETDNSLFTHFLVEGLEGEADLDGDGRITVDELYDYAYEKVKHATPKQTPSKFSSKQQGEIILRQNMRIEEIRSVPLPAPLLDSIDNPFSDIRLGAVQQLTKLLNGKNLGMARSAREALEKIAEEDDSRQVQRAAAQALESTREEGGKVEVAEPEVRAKEAERIVQPQAVEAKRVAPREIPSVEKFSAPVSIQQAIFGITLGWTIGGAIGGAVYWAGGDFSVPLGAAIGWGVGGFVTVIALRAMGILSSEKNIYLVTLAWMIGSMFGWSIGDQITEAYGAAIGESIGLVIALAGTFGADRLLARWKDMLWLIFFWAISSMVGWSVGKSIQEAEGFVSSLYIGKTAGWSLGWAISGAIGGYALGWWLLKNASGSSKGVFNSYQPSRIKLTEPQKAFLLSPLGRSLLGVTVGLILGILFGVVYGIINDISYDFAYAYSTFHGDVPHIFLLIICGFAGFVAYPHRVTVPLLIGGFILSCIIGLSQRQLLYELLKFGGMYGLPVGAMISRILYWLKVIK